MIDIRNLLDRYYLQRDGKGKNVGTKADWICEVYQGGIIIKFGTHGTNLQVREILSYSPMEEAYKRVKKQWNKGYITIEHGVRVTSQPAPAPDKPEKPKKPKKARKTPLQKAVAAYNAEAADDWVF